MKTKALNSNYKPKRIINIELFQPALLTIVASLLIYTFKCLLGKTYCLTCVLIIKEYKV